MVSAKHEYYRNALKGTDKVLCKESAAEYLNLSNGNFGTEIETYETKVGKEVIQLHGILCTSINQTINDLLADQMSDEQVILESLDTYYYQHNQSFDGLNIDTQNQKLFLELSEAALHYYEE